jgi:Transglutaminase-like superfamily
MWERLRRFSNLPAPARGLFLRAAVLLPWVALRLKLHGFRATNNSLQNPSETFPSPGTLQSAQRVHWTARMVRAAARHGLGNPSCLEESLVLAHLLRRQGIASQLRIGVKKNIPKFEAHAWVEWGSVALNESDALHDHYARFEAEFSANPPAQS